MLNVRDEARYKPVRQYPVNGTTNSKAQAVSQPKVLTWPWSYDTTKYGSRDVRLDLLRGFCLFVMLVDHIGVFGPDSWVYTATGRGDFFISAAEGFVFISGLVMGLVYTKIIAKEGLQKTTSKIFARVVKLYWLSVGITLFFSALAYFTPLHLWADRDWIQIKDPVEMIIGTLSMHFAFHGASIMVMYVLFLAMAPLIFYLLKQQKTVVVLAISWLVWLANQFYPNQFSIPFASNFPFAAWQVLFVSGLVIGYHRQKLATLLSEKWRGYYAIGVGGAAILLLSFYLASQNGTLAGIFPATDFGWLLQDLKDKGNLPLARMVSVFIFFQAFYLLATWLWKPLDTVLGWLLVPLGEVALYSFTMHLAVIVLFYNLPGVRELPYFLYGFALLGAALVLWAMVKTRFLFRFIPK